ncbi:unnamed protein product [Auanema sp. JU1783]|nr:unnamed protein product [Auanema sp. JU1783]
MARNAEKAMTALARWRRMKEEEERGPVARRPIDVKQCAKLADAERFRREIARDISKKIALIQNPGLGEFKIRDMNDEINKLLRVKNQWELRIMELGGQDYRKYRPRELDKDGREVSTDKGYKYFGAAKDLPGVRELFEQSKELDKMKQSRGDLIKNIDADYYGYLDDDDGLIVPLELDEEVRAIQSAKENFAKNGGERLPKEFGDDEDDDIYKVEDSDEEDIDTKESVVVGEDGRNMTIRHAMVPSQKEIEELILDRKKQTLIDRYLS